MNRWKLIVLLGLTHACSAAIAQVQPSNFLVVDSANRVVGQWNAIGTTDLLVAGNQVTVAVSRDGLRQGDRTVFASGDCTGPAYLTVMNPLSNLRTPYAVVGTDWQVFLATSDVPVTVVVGSWLGDGSCQASSYATSARPASRIGVLSELYTAPFSLLPIPLAFGTGAAPAPAMSGPGLILMASAVLLAGIAAIRRMRQANR